MLNKELGLSQGKVCRFLDTFFGIKLSRGGSCQIMQRAAATCESHYADIVTRVQNSPFIVPDETGWRIGGRLAWLHVAVGQQATAYLIARGRGKEASDLLIGPDYAGHMTHDGWSPYDQFDRADHQTCLGHLSQRCKKLLEIASSAAAWFPRQVKGLLKWALELRDQRDAGAITRASCVRAGGGLEVLMRYLLEPVQSDAANERLARHLRKHLHQLFTFLRHEGIDATNHKAEQAIRPAVVNRKVWGGNRTPAGAMAQAILMSVLVTLRQNGQDALTFVSRQLRSPQLIALPVPAG
jgi:transposase